MNAPSLPSQPSAPTANDPLSAAAWARFRADIRAHTAARLPDAMVPARFVVLPELPKLPNGKIDRGRLARGPAEATPDSAHLPPETPEELRLTALWADVLDAPRVGVRDNFFELGGDSLAAAQMAARLRADTGARVNLRRFFENPTVEHLIALLGGGGRTPDTVRRHPRSVPAADLAADAELPADIAPEPGAAPPSGGPYRSVLLTGGTGYTGAFLLRALLDRSDAHLHVLVRADRPSAAIARVRAAMERYGVWRAGDERRLTGVPGDLARPHLGLDRNTHQRLARDIEMIVHNGAWSSYALPYRRLKPVNVLGTREVLALAARHRVKPVHYTSSLAVYPGHPGRHHWAEDAATAPEGVVGGYRQTKWVGDRMMAEAHRRGIPTCVYRPGQVSGAQSTGACSTDTFLNATLKGCVQLGAALEFDVTLELTPVDFFADALAHVALGGRWHGTAFNVPAARTLSWHRLVELLGECGYPLRLLPYRDWYRELSGAVERGEENELARFLPLFGEEAPSEDLGYRGSEPEFATTNLRAALTGSGISCGPPDRELIDRFLTHFAATGYLPPPRGAVPPGTAPRVTPPSTAPRRTTP
ncbi:thioester reductase domain-containing protein [Streptomyces sp. NPDC001985]|uniref:thioester reductase domain-containing protein n=1 Tax=Streptomyces sp. NPDC001985 TaxID=3154406 RepID=UPI00331716B7